MESADGEESYYHQIEELLEEICDARPEISPRLLADDDEPLVYSGKDYSLQKRAFGHCGMAQIPC